ncbi:hypothetical protein ACQ4WX_22150 [Streptomyces lasalocidi]
MTAMFMPSMESDNSFDSVSSSLITVSYVLNSPAASVHAPAPPPNWWRASCSCPISPGPACEPFRSWIRPSTRFWKVVKEDSSVATSATASRAMSNRPDIHDDVPGADPPSLGNTTSSPYRQNNRSPEVHQQL